MKKLMWTTLLILFATCLMACGPSADDLVGIWKSEQGSSLTGRPTLLFITKDTIAKNKFQPDKIVFEKDSDKIKIRFAPNNNLLYTASEITENTVYFYWVGGESGTFTRITQEEADALLAKYRY